MKKVSSLIIALVCVFSLTGCGTKNVTCTTGDDSQSITVVTSFNGKEATKISMETAIKVDEDQVDQAYTSLDTAKAMYENQSGVKVSTSKGKDSVSLKLEMELSKLDEDTLDSMGLDGVDFKNTSSDEYAKAMEDQGYTCK